MKAKKQSNLKLIVTTILVAALFNCMPEKGANKNKVSSNLAILVKSEPARSESNFNENQIGATRSLLGPDKNVSQSVLSLPTVNELKNNVTTNIKEGDTNIEVNLPLEATLSNGLNASNSNSNNSFFVNPDGTVIYSRIVVDGNKTTLIPQIRLQPNKNYIALIGGIQNAKGESLGNLKISFTNKDLDYGLYWFGKYGVCEKYFPNIKNAFYNPAKQTVVFAHGWQANSVIGTDVYGRSGFRYEMFYWNEDNFGGAKEYNGLKQFTNHSWIDKGWNTGIVYWNQFADEPVASEGNFLGVKAAEAKIWNLFEGPNGSRYRTLDANGNDLYKNWDGKLLFKGQSIQVNSIGSLLSLYVVDALKNNVSGNIRLVGHSLGNQVITHIAGKVNEAGIKINRIALLDPAWTDGAKSYLPLVTTNDLNVKLNHNGAKALNITSLGRHFWLTEYCRVILYTIMNSQWNSGIVVERYNSTALNLYMPIMDENAELSKQISVTDIKPWFYSATQLGDKHVVIRHHYFWSMESLAPVECKVFFTVRKPTGNSAISAATPDTRVRESMLSGYYHSQVEGRYTPDTSDDWYEVKQKL